MEIKKIYLLLYIYCMLCEIEYEEFIADEINITTY